MATNPELLKADDSVKRKYLDIVTNLPVKELKKFKKTEYQKLVLIDLMELLPDLDKSQLNETAHYVSNALNNAVKVVLPKRLRDSSVSKTKNQTLLSESVLEDLDTTMRPESTQHPDERRDENEDDQCDNDDENEVNACNDDNNRTMDDSITLLKQTTTTVSEKSTDKNKKDNPSSKCCETCNLKPKPRKPYPMTRCSLCMVWYHDQCVGLDKDEPVGVWLCVMCRQVPQGLQDNLIDIKTDIEQLKEAFDHHNIKYIIN